LDLEAPQRKAVQTKAQTLQERGFWPSTQYGEQIKKLSDSEIMRDYFKARREKKWIATNQLIQVQ